METTEAPLGRNIPPSEFSLPKNLGKPITWYAKELGISVNTLSALLKKELSPMDDFTDMQAEGLRILNFKPAGSLRLARIISKQEKVLKKTNTIQEGTSEQVQQVIEGIGRHQLGEILPNTPVNAALYEYWNRSTQRNQSWFKLRIRDKRQEGVWILQKEHYGDFIAGYERYRTKLNALIAQRKERTRNILTTTV